MYGSGHALSMTVNIMVKKKGVLVIVILLMIAFLFCAVAPGALNHGACVPPPAAGTRLTPASSISVFGSPGPFNFLFFPFNLFRVSST